jgi:hypothetical protein
MTTVTFQTEDGPVAFEVATAGAGVGAVSAREVPLVPEQRLEAALGLVGRVAASLERSLEKLEFAKAEATIGIKLSAEGSFIVAKSSAEASISVTLSLSKGSA